MNREILFRGKRLDKFKPGEWIYGYYVPCCFGSFPCRPAIVPEPDGKWEPFEVDPATVGQYTGLTDIKKHKAFVDDIVRYKNAHTVYGIIRFGEIPDQENRLKHIGYYIEWQNDGANMWRDWWRCDLGYWIENPDCEICGNIHDNPELMGGEDDG